MRRTIGITFLLATWLCGPLTAKGLRPFYCHRPGLHHHHTTTEASAVEPPTSQQQAEKGTKIKPGPAKRNPSVPGGASAAPSRKNPSNLKPETGFHLAK